MKIPKIKSLNCLLVFLLLQFIFGWCDFREFVILFFLQKYKYLRYVHNKYNHSINGGTKNPVTQSHRRLPTHKDVGCWRGRVPVSQHRAVALDVFADLRCHHHFRRHQKIWHPEKSLWFCGRVQRSTRNWVGELECGREWRSDLQILIQEKEVWNCVSGKEERDKPDWHTHKANEQKLWAQNPRAITETQCSCWQKNRDSH